MSISGVNGTVPVMPEAIHDLKAEIAQLHAQAGTNTPTDPTFQQGILQVHSDIHALSQAVATLKDDLKGGQTPSPGDVKAVKQDFAAVTGSLKGLADQFGNPIPEPPQPGPATRPPGVDVMA